MTSRQRVLAALHRQPADRVPIFMWFHPGAVEQLASLLEIAPSSVCDAMGNDIVQTWVNNNYAMEGIVHERDGEWHVDEWGVSWTRQFYFNQISHHPLAGKPREEVLAYRFPDDRTPFLLSRMEAVLANRGDRFVGCDVSPCVFEMYWRLRGMEDAMLDIANDPDLAFEMFSRCADFAIRVGEEACVRFPLDWYWTGDDVAGQRSMMMSPHSWRRLIKPHLERVFETGRKHGLPIAYHCCGALRPIIGDLVEMGLTVLNPIQANCPGMDAAELKGEFGRQLTFMGGVDTQWLLPRGTVLEVLYSTQRLIETMTSNGGGYILAASHTISPETPPENIFALYEAAGVSRQEIFDRAATIRGSSGH